MPPMRLAGWARAHVTIVYRRTESDMPAFGFEYEHAKQEGVVFEWLAQPVAIHCDPANEAASCADGMAFGRARVFSFRATW